MKIVKHCQNFQKSAERFQLMMDIIDIAQKNTDSPYEAQDVLQMAAFMYPKMQKNPASRRDLTPAFPEGKKVNNG